MTHLRILIKMESADAFELKAQALNNASYLKEAGVAALKFTGDKKYIADGEFLSEPRSPATSVMDSPKNKSAPAFGKRLRVVLRLPNEDALESKVQALNHDSRLGNLGIVALKFVGERQYIRQEKFSSEFPSTDLAENPNKPKSDATRKRVRVVLRTPSEDAYELKAQALNNDPRLKDAGIAALKIVGDKLFISGGEFSPELSPPDFEQDFTIGKKVRVKLRVPRKDAYELVAKHLNNDPELIKAGISSMGLAKDAELVEVAKETSAPPHKKKWSFARYVFSAVIVGLIGVTGAGALFFSNPPTPTPTTAFLIPVSGGEPTYTNTPVPATETNIHPTGTATMDFTSTKTPPPTATNTQTPTATVLSCQLPNEAMVTAEKLSCRYGPGAVYLYRTGLSKGNVVDILGRADTAYGTWIRVQTRWQEPVKCWVNSGLKYVEISQGDVACLDPLYPEKAPLILFNTNLFPKPYNVGASRSGDLVYINWQGFDLLPGDRPEASPPYLVETWTCQDGKTVFSPQGLEISYATVRDEGGCAEASYGYVYLAHVDGYIGPVRIPWPP